MDFTVTASSGKKAYIRAAGFKQAVDKYMEIRKSELNVENKGSKAVSTIRAELNGSGTYDCNGTRFNLLVKWFVPTVPKDRTAEYDTRGEEAMKRGYGHY